MLPALFHISLKCLFSRNSELPFSTYYRFFDFIILSLGWVIGFGLIQLSVLTVDSIFSG